MNEQRMPPDQIKTITSKAAEHLFRRDYVRARKLYETLLRDNQTDVVAMTGLGKALEGMGNFSYAVKAFRSAIEISPNAFDAIHHLGRLLLNSNRTDKAIAFLESAANSGQGSHAAWTDLGVAQKLVGDFDAARDSLDHAIKLNPESIEARFNLAACLREIGLVDDARSLLENIIKTDPEFGGAPNLLASIHSDLNEPDQAMSVLNNYLAAHPNDVESRQNGSLIQLRSGRVAEGFDAYEWRLSPNQRSVPVRPFTQKFWRGEQLDGEHLLIWLEQGLGDEILSLSMLKDVLEKAPHCSIECDHRLLEIVARSFPTVTAIGRQDPPASETDRADYTFPVWSAARLFRRSWDQFPQHSGYLKADDAGVSAIRKRYEEKAKGRRLIGLSWSSVSRGGRLKTPPLEYWRAILEDPKNFFVGLQYAPQQHDIDILSQLGEAGFYMDPTIDTQNDLESAAAQIGALDAVVSISNSTAHLAGALGKPIATVIPEGYGSFWYWHRDHDQSPWYPSMRICRQNSPGDWPSAMSKARAWLETG